jgi:hypothetical protein
MEVSRVDCRVRTWSFSDVSGTNAFPIRRVCWWFGSTSYQHTLKKKTDLVPETSESLHILTQLSARENLLNSVAAKASWHTVRCGHAVCLCYVMLTANTNYFCGHAVYLGYVMLTANTNYFCGHAVYLCYLMLTATTNYYPKENKLLSHYNTNYKLCDVGTEGLCIRECQSSKKKKKEGLVRWILNFI